MYEFIDRPHEIYEFIDLVREKSHDKIRLGELFKDGNFSEKKNFQYQQIRTTRQ